VIRSGDVLHGGEDAALEVGPAGAEILVGGVEQSLQRRPHRLVPAHVTAEPLLERVAGILAPGSLGEIVRLLVPAAGDVVLEQAAHPRSLVEAREDGTTTSPCMAMGRLARIMAPRRLALPSRERFSPSTFS
jgi:hypothetical protein